MRNTGQPSCSSRLRGTLLVVRRCIFERVENTRADDQIGECTDDQCRSANVLLLHLKWIVEFAGGELLRLLDQGVS